MGRIEERRPAGREAPIVIGPRSAARLIRQLATNVGAIARRAKRG